MARVGTTGGEVVLAREPYSASTSSSPTNGDSSSSSNETTSRGNKHGR